MAVEQPVCPRGWACEFEQIPPPEERWIGPWYEGAWGIVATGVAIVAVVIIIWIIAYYWHEARDSKRAALERERERKHDLAIEEQRTLQADSAKGDPEMLKLIRGR
jgi:hypothetical protein